VKQPFLLPELKLFLPLVMALAAIGCFVLTLSNVWAAAPTFSKATYSEIGGSVVVGDFNGDGKPDIASVTWLDGRVRIRHGNGEGGFGSTSTHNTIGTGPYTLLAVDINRDGKDDIIVPHFDGPRGDFSILQNNGSGFTLSSDSAGGFPWKVVAGDFDRDGKPDLAFAVGTELVIKLGNGDGTFQSGTPYVTGPNSSPTSVAVGDFNRDGKPDLAVANLNENNVSILFGNGDGTFITPSTVVVPVGGNDPTHVVTGDFNRDGFLDLVVANRGNGGGGASVSTLLGDGTGNFTLSFTYNSPAGAPQEVRVADFNGDGIDDVVVAVANGSATGWVLTGSGDGINFAPVSLDAAGGSLAAAVGDFNLDGKPDPVLVSNEASVFINTTAFEPAGFFGAPSNYTAAGQLSIAIGDFNRDGVQDLVTAGSGEYNVLLGAIDGTFPVVLNSAIGGPRSVAVGDFDRDGVQDIATANSTANNVTIFLGNDDGTFAALTNFSVGNQPVAIKLGDFNGDGKQDIAVANSNASPSGTVSILLGNGDGTFGNATSYATGNFPNAIAVADFNRDGKQDLAVANGGNTVSILIGNGDGTFAPAVNYFGTSGIQPVDVVVGDFNRDGTQDLAIAIPGSLNLAVSLGNGDGTFDDVITYTGTGSWSLTTDDFNRDGKQDLALSNRTGNSVSILLGNGDGSFGTALNYSTGATPQGVISGDFNRDGRRDLAVVNFGSGTVSILLNQIPPADLSVGIIDSPDPATVGANLTYTITVANSGTVDATGVVLNDPLPASVQFISATTSQGSCTTPAVGSTGTVNCTLGTVSSSTPVTVTIVVNPIISGFVINTVTVSGNEVVPSAGNNTAVATTAINPPPAFLTTSLVNIVNGSPYTQLLAFSGGTGNLTCSFAGGTLPSGLSIASDCAIEGTSTVNGTNNFTVRVTDANGIFTDQSFSIVVSPLSTANVAFTTTPLPTCTPGPCSPPAIAGKPYGATNGNSQVAIADFDRDGIQDIAVTSSATDKVYILLGKDDYAVVNQEYDIISDLGGGGAFAIAVSDFNGDGNPDLAITHMAYYLKILLGNGNGTFQAADTYPAGNQAQTLAIGDFNNDGLPDVVVGNVQSASILVYIGGDNPNTPPESRVELFKEIVLKDLSTVGRPKSVAVGDFNRDGLQDLAFVNWGALDNSISIMFGNGQTGSYFSAPIKYAAGTSPSGLAIGDFNEDGIQDIAVANDISNDVSILLGKPDGSFQAPIDFPTGITAHRVLVSDFNGDGHQDLAVANYANTGSISVFIGNGQGAFAAPVNLVGATGPLGLAVGDLNRDGKPDVVASYFDGSLTFFRNNTPVPPLVIYTSNSAADTISIVDGLIDIGNGIVPVAEEAVSVGAGPLGVAVGPDGMEIYVASQTGNTISIIDGITRAEVARIPAPWPAVTPNAVVVSPSGHRAYVTFSNAFAVLNPSSLQFGPVLLLGNPNTGGPAGVALNPQGTRAYVALPGTSSLAILDVTTDTPILITEISVGTACLQVAVNQAGTKAYVTCWNASAVIEIDTMTYQQRVVALGAPSGIVFNPATNRIYVASPMFNILSVIDSTTFNVIDQIQVPGGPGSVALDKSNTLAYVVSGASDTLHIVNLLTRTIDYSIAVGDAPSIFGSYFAGVNVSLPKVSTTSLQNATEGSAYTEALAGSGGLRPRTWSVISGTLPDGLNLSTAGLVTGTPTSAGTSNFTLRLTDSNGMFDDQLLSLTVNPLNFAPLTNPDNKTTTRNVALVFPATDLSSNDSPGPASESSQTLAVTSVSTFSDAGGTASLSAGQVTYTPSVNFLGIDAFSYIICDNGIPSQCSAGTVNVNVTPPNTVANDPPTAFNDTYSIDQDTQLIVAASGILANDFDPESATLSAELVIPPPTGTLILAPDGSFTYTPAVGFTGALNFSYLARDSANLSSNLATVAISVVPTGVAATDIDGDGVLDVFDNCPLTPNPSQENRDGDNEGDDCDTDADNDGIPDKSESAVPGVFVVIPVSSGGDNCPLVHTYNQNDFDGDGIGDECDVDADGDGFGNASRTPDSNIIYDGRTGTQIGPYSDLEPLPFGAIRGGDCDDGNSLVYPGTTDCVGSADFQLAPGSKTSSSSSCDATSATADCDLDGLTRSQELALGSDPAAADTDGDSVKDGADNCALTPNADQRDTDGDGLGDACDTDADGDGIADKILGTKTGFVQSYNAIPPSGGDNCPLVRNPGQTNLDGDGLGDACDPDTDGDGFGNSNQTPLVNTIYNGTTGAVIGPYTGTLLAGQIRGGDCNDADPTVNPGRVEVQNNGKDDDCNPNTADSSYSIRFDLLRGGTAISLDTWLPTDGDAVTVVARVVDGAGTPLVSQPAITFSRESVTDHFGKFTNDPGTGNAATDNADDFTHSFGVNTINLTSLDYGGKVTFLAQTNVNNVPVSKSVSLPKDDNNNEIADAWEAQYGGNLSKDDDKDTSVGNTHNGDGLTVFEEYRGFVWGPPLVQMTDIGQAINQKIYQTATWIPQGTAAHFRTNPTRKNVFVKYSGFSAANPFALGTALSAVGIDVHVLDLAVTPIPPAENITPVLVRNLFTSFGLEDGHINKRGVRDWSWDTKGSASIGTGSGPGIASLYQVPLDFYMDANLRDRPYRDGNRDGITGRNDRLDPIAAVEDANDNGVGPESIKGKSEDSLVINAILDNDVYVAGRFDQHLSPFDIDNNGFVELPVASNPVSCTAPNTPVGCIDRNFEYTKAHVLKHSITHELVHALGALHDADANSLMYEYSTSWSRDGNLSTVAKSQIIVINQ